jgi:hypothetical protein
MADPVPDAAPGRAVFCVAALKRNDLKREFTTRTFDGVLAEVTDGRHSRLYEIPA